MIRNSIIGKMSRLRIIISFQSYGRFSIMQVSDIIITSYRADKLEDENALHSTHSDVVSRFHVVTSLTVSTRTLRLYAAAQFHAIGTSRCYFSTPMRPL